MTTPKRGRGRPPLPEAERRKHRTLVRWTADELEMLEARAEAAGVPVAVFVRLSVLEQLDA